MRGLQGLLLIMLLSAAVADEYHPERHEIIRTQPDRNINAFNTAERSPDFWKTEAIIGIEKRIKEVQNNKVARNVIMFLGDGMSIPTLMAARTFKGQRENKTGEESHLFFEEFPTVGLSKTYCLNHQIPDSACTATAYLAGVKNNYGTIGVSGEVSRRDCQNSNNTAHHLDSIAAWALADGRDAGIVTTTRITHASPAGAYARTANRDWESDASVISANFNPEICHDIAHQLIHTSPGNQFKVILGGGRRAFLPNTTIDDEGEMGVRRDGHNLIQEWLDDKSSRGVTHRYVWNRSQLMTQITSPTDYILGLFDSSHMPYHLQSDSQSDPTLAEMTEVAISTLSKNEKGYFLFVEGGRIDHAHHDTWPHLALDETVELDKAIQKAVEMVGDDTLIVVTADHAHVMSINGYSQRGNPILGKSDMLGDDGVAYMTLSYTNGPGARNHTSSGRPDVTKDSNFLELEWRTHADVYLESETHGGDDVAVLAYGPHHHMFTGVYEQSQIPWRMAYAACIGPGAHSEHCNSASLYTPLTILYAAALTVLYRAF